MLLVAVYRAGEISPFSINFCEEISESALDLCLYDVNGNVITTIWDYSHIKVFSIEGADKQQRILDSFLDFIRIMNE